MRPTRETATNNRQTYFVTSSTAERKAFFRHEPWAKLFIETLYSYRPERYAVHGFTVMPDHVHCLITPAASLELAVQCLKGGFSFRAKRALEWRGEIWAAGFSDHRIRDLEDVGVHERYIARNAVKAGLVKRAEEYAYCSANGRFELDAFPQGLKPQFVGTANGGAEAPPFQNMSKVPPRQNISDAEVPPRQNISDAEAPPFQNITDAEAPPRQKNKMEGR